MIIFENILGGLQDGVVFLLFLSVLILVHEWGHFITAKLLGVEVKEFALGFGPTLWQKKWHQTNYMVKVFPLGGYVRMAGDERSKCSGQPQEFYSKSPGARALIVFNGPLINVALAYLTFVMVFLIGYPGLSTKVTEIIPSGQAITSGIKAGDKIVAIDGKKVYGWMHLTRLLEGDSPEAVMVTYKHKGQLQTAQIKPKVKADATLLGEPTMVRHLGLAYLPNEIGGVAKDYPAAEIGLKAGDKIIEIDGMPVSSWTTIERTIKKTKNKTIHIKYERADEILEAHVEPFIEYRQGPDGEQQEIRKIGIGPIIQDFGLFRFSLGESLVNAGEELWFITVLTYKALYRMVTGAMSAKENVTGPVGIFYIVKGAAEAGMSHLLFILGVISASLAIFNLLPILPLDGGHLMLLAIEKVRGKPLSEKVDDYVARFGFTLIILLAIFVFYNDFARFGWFDGVKKLFQAIFNFK